MHEDWVMRESDRVPLFNAAGKCHPVAHEQGFTRALMAVPFLACMLATAHFYALPPRVLPAIQAVEGGRPGLVHANPDGSADLGLMQINTLWVPLVAQVVGADASSTRAKLTADACFSIAAAGAILSAYLRETQGNLMQAVGDYHSHTGPLNLSYQALVRSRAAVLFASAGR